MSDSESMEDVVFSYQAAAILEAFGIDATARSVLIVFLGGDTGSVHVVTKRGQSLFKKFKYSSEWAKGLLAAVGLRDDVRAHSIAIGLNGGGDPLVDLTIQRVARKSLLELDWAALKAFNEQDHED